VREQLNGGRRKKNKVSSSSSPSASGSTQGSNSKNITAKSSENTAVVDLDGIATSINLGDLQSFGIGDSDSDDSQAEKIAV